MYDNCIEPVDSSHTQQQITDDIYDPFTGKQQKQCDDIFAVLLYP